MKRSIHRPVFIRWRDLPFNILILTAIFWSTASAVGIHPRVKQQLIAEGRWERTLEVIHAARQAGMDAGNPDGSIPFAAGTQGTKFASRIPCILVEFSDNPWSDGIYTPRARIDSMLFSDHLYPTGSMRDYYLENSYGTFDIEGEVVGPLMMPRPYADYVRGRMGIATDTANSQTLARDAVLAADSLIDFSQYDANDDGLVDGVMIVFAEFGYEESLDTNKIQSHSWYLPTHMLVNLDGKTIKAFTMQPEEHGPRSKAPMPSTNAIGVFCHEWGHVLGLIDLYDTDYSSWGVGKWSLMGMGNYLDDGKTPSHFDPWCKSRLGWVAVEVVESNRVNQSLPAFATSPTVFRLWMPGLMGKEYFLVCNRRKTGFDAELPGQGLMILHIDDAKSTNSQEYIPGQGDPASHYKVAVVQADGMYQLEDSASTGSDSEDLYTNLTREFDDLTYPSSRSYGSMATQVAVWNISAPGPTMTANLDVTFSRPRLALIGNSFIQTSGDGDEIIDPGESFNLLLTTENVWKPTADIELVVTCSNPAVSFANNISTIAALGTNETYTNHADPIAFTVAAGSRPMITDFFIDYTCEGRLFHFADTVRVDVGPKQVLLLDGDQDYSKDRSFYYISALENLRVPYGVHDKKASGSPPASLLAQYPMVLWWTGNHRTSPVAAGDSTLVHADVVALQSYLDGGGRLFLTGQDIAQYLSLTDPEFLRQYLGAQYGGSSQDPPFVTGLTGDPVGEGVSLVLGGTGSAANQTHPDNLVPAAGASASFIYSPYGTGKTAAITLASGTFKTVFWGFGLEGINNTLPQDGVTREKALARVLGWLINLATGVLEDDDYSADETAGNRVPSRYTLLQNYPNPFNGQTTIEFTIAAGEPALVQVEIFDILGRKVRTLREGTLESGRHQIVWDGKNRTGQDVSSGVYFCRVVSADGFVGSRRMVYLK